MTYYQLSIPVAFIIFNRPDTTARVFEEIRRAQPPQLLVIADGPRLNHPEDVEKCAAARAIIEQVDWDCKVLRDFAESNMGCKQRVSSGLDWVFGTVQEAIILEDDCLPHPTFFQFCQELLKHYRDDTRIMAINGTNVLGKWKADIQDYHFSYHGGVWGWASWRRAWEYYDASMSMWNDAEVRKRIRLAFRTSRSGLCAPIYGYHSPSKRYIWCRTNRLKRPQQTPIPYMGGLQC